MVNAETTRGKHRGFKSNTGEKSSLLFILYRSIRRSERCVEETLGRRVVDEPLRIPSSSRMREVVPLRRDRPEDDVDEGKL